MVIGRQGDGHAVLTVKTDHGDFVLDNMRDDIPSRLGEDGLSLRSKRQSQEDQNRWVALDGGVRLRPPLAR